MDKIQEVRSIIVDYGTRKITEESTAYIAKEICQLFEPKPDEGSLLEEELRKIWLWWQESGENYGQLIDAVSARAASIVRAEERERILKLLPEITTRFDHNKTCFDCVENIRRQALKPDEITRNTAGDPELGQE